MPQGFQIEREDRQGIHVIFHNKYLQGPRLTSRFGANGFHYGSSSRQSEGDLRGEHRTPFSILRSLLACGRTIHWEVMVVGAASQADQENCLVSLERRVQLFFIDPPLKEISWITKLHLVAPARKTRRATG